MPHDPLQANVNAARTDTPGAKGKTRVPIPIRHAPADTPELWVVRLARACASGLIDGAEARRRLDAYAAGRGAKTARYLAHRLYFLMSNILPRDAPQIVAGCVADTEAHFGGLLQYVPQWVRDTRSPGTARLYARLYFFALALGWGGRDFEMAQSMAAKLFGVHFAGTVTEFIRKAVKNGFVEIVLKGKPHGNGAHGRGTVYRLIHSGGAIDNAIGFMHGLLLERLPCLVERRGI